VKRSAALRQALRQAQGKLRASSGQVGSPSTGPSTGPSTSPSTGPSTGPSTSPSASSGLAQGKLRASWQWAVERKRLVGRPSVVGGSIDRQPNRNPCAFTPGTEPRPTTGAAAPCRPTLCGRRMVSGEAVKRCASPIVNRDRRTRSSTGLRSEVGITIVQADVQW
jgi:hypothetical protein